MRIDIDIHGARWSRAITTLIMTEHPTASDCHIYPAIGPKPGLTPISRFPSGPAGKKKSTRLGFALPPAGSSSI